MADLVILLLACVAVTALVYSRAFHLHNLIERHHPGLNAAMRRRCGWLQRWWK